MMLSSFFPFFLSNNIDCFELRDRLREQRQLNMASTIRIKEQSLDEAVLLYYMNHKEPRADLPIKVYLGRFRIRWESQEERIETLKLLESIVDISRLEEEQEI
jgi:hypothetical protein